VAILHVAAALAVVAPSVRFDQADDLTEFHRRSFYRIRSEFRFPLSTVPGLMMRA
jgi:hypothetical protein